MIAKTFTLFLVDRSLNARRFLKFYTTRGVMTEKELGERKRVLEEVLRLLSGLIVSFVKR